MKKKVIRAGDFPGVGARRKRRLVNKRAMLPLRLVGLRRGEFFQCVNCHARSDEPHLFRVDHVRRCDLVVGGRYQGKCSRCPSRRLVFMYDPVVMHKGKLAFPRGDQRLQYQHAMPTCKGCCLNMSCHWHEVGLRVQDVKFCCGRKACCRKITRHPERTPMTLPSLY